MSNRFLKLRELGSKGKKCNPLVLEEFQWENEWVDAACDPVYQGDDITWAQVDEVVSASEGLRGRNLPRAATNKRRAATATPATTKKRKTRRTASIPREDEELSEEEDDAAMDYIPSQENEDEEDDEDSGGGDAATAAGGFQVDESLL
ncbi:hypothetical protein PR202_ga30101 [Eleusine coracana subsp. coracana]|uniref:Uncharacterized protein n=1 Tax=Eleusine coracana subsp. coracana TaxID=191504 RepID=A0AAV5DN10_ELECO|nr:hypothetical protein PR202_ga30101 [Eleusine coracana subsp. coracana]